MSMAVQHHSTLNPPHPRQRRGLRVLLLAALACIRRLVYIVQYLNTEHVRSAHVQYGEHGWRNFRWMRRFFLACSAPSPFWAAFI